MLSISQFLLDYQGPIIIVGAFIFAVVWVVSWYKDVNQDRKDFRSRIQASEKLILTMEEAIKAIQEDIREIKHNLRGSPPATTPGSPLRLTEFGEMLSETLGVKEWAEETANRLLPEVQGEDRYGVQ